MEAAGRNETATVRAMLDSGTNVNKKHHGWTALMVAAFHGNGDAVKLLLERGANPNIVSTGPLPGRTALGIAQEKGHSSTVQLLLQVGGRALAAEPTAPRGKAEVAGGQTLAPPPAAQAIAYDAPKADVRPAARASDVDAPRYKMSLRPSDYALVIGVERYSKLPSASFAERDADAVRNHLEAMGFPPRNIIYLKGQAATRGALQAYIEEWLPKNVKPESTLFFFYSGHGAPDPKTGDAFLVPWDGDAMFLQSTAYPLKQLYSSLAKLKAREVIIALDSCFSGAGGRSVLAAGARPLVMKINTGVVPQGNMTLFAAASGDEITGSLEEQGHGIFTYYFLKGLNGAAKDSSGAVTTKGLYEYLKPNVQDEASRQNRQQTPKLVETQERTIVKF